LGSSPSTTSSRPLPAGLRPARVLQLSVQPARSPGLVRRRGVRRCHGSASTLGATSARPSRQLQGLSDPSEARSHAPAARSTVRPIRVDERLLPPHLFRPVPSAKKPTFEPTNPSQSVARSCTPLQTTRGTAFWTSQNATMRDDPTRPATLLSYLRIRRLGIQGDRLQLRTTQPGRHSPGPTGHLSWRSNRPTRVDQTVRRPAPRAHAAREYAAYRLPVLTGGCPPPA